MQEAPANRIQTGAAAMIFDLTEADFEATGQ
jgi:hypothetical protein